MFGMGSSSVIYLYTVTIMCDLLCLDSAPVDTMNRMKKAPMITLQVPSLANLVIPGNRSSYP